DYHRY
ncbi:hypothetical protein D043_0549B, partial [Vibrio parahaemolyticus EKP-021]